MNKTEQINMQDLKWPLSARCLKASKHFARSIQVVMGHGRIAANGALATEHSLGDVACSFSHSSFLEKCCNRPKLKTSTNFSWIP